MFLADSPGIWGGTPETQKRNGKLVHFEPVTLFAALSSVTKSIGFIATASTTYEEPYNLARKFASLDYLSNGRAGWNVVTTGNENAAANFGLEYHPEHGERYERAEEFVEVVKGLWDSWEDDAFLRNRESGIYFDPDKLHVLNHKGKYFSVKGPLNVGRPPQGYPVIVQAGASEAGRELKVMTEYSRLKSSRSAVIKSKLNYPVIDTDVHTNDFTPALEDYIANYGGSRLVDALRKAESSRLNSKVRGKDWYQQTPEERQYYRTIRSPWWARVTRNTLDLATYTLPELFYERQAEQGSDYSVLFPNNVLAPTGASNEDRQALQRAINHYHADLYRKYSVFLN